MVKLSVVDAKPPIAAPATPRCTCSVCRHLAAAVNREFVLELHARIPFADFEAEVAKRWHEYRPYFDAACERLPTRAVHEAIAETRETSAIKKLLAWNDEASCEQNIAVLSGPPGTGKTIAAVWLALHRGATDDPRFLTAQQFARLRRDERETFLAAASTSLVLLDDLGTELLDDRFVADFDELVDTVYQTHAAMIITTNCTPVEFKRRYGVRVVDRLAERGEWINVGGKSMRAKPQGRDGE